MTNEYITSERFIWDDLLRRGEAVAERAKKMWNRRQSLPTSLLSWPSEEIKDDQGNPIDRVVSLAVPEHIPLRKALVDMLERTLPYALLLAEVRDKELVVILESHHGTRSWRYPIEWRGDVHRLGEGIRKDNTDSLGVLWRRQAGDDS